MTCTLSDVPAADAIDIPALKAKYREERARRMRADAQEQYAPSDDNLTHDTYEHDPYTPIVPRDAIDEDLDVLVMGAGWSGVQSAVYLRKMGVTNFRNVDHAGDFGGTWYWNR
ncbi:MAG: monooxygenase, partial [Novosphingobium sp.]|nr:monooxygenase [Novosphingobium sp.]